MEDLFIAESHSTQMNMGNLHVYTVNKDYNSGIGNSPDYQSGNKYWPHKRPRDIPKQLPTAVNE